MPRSLSEERHPDPEPGPPHCVPDESRSRAGAGGRSMDQDQPLDPMDDKGDYLNPVDLASALSFPASDPPAISGPA